MFYVYLFFHAWNQTLFVCSCVLGCYNIMCCIYSNNLLLYPIVFVALSVLKPSSDTLLFALFAFITLVGCHHMFYALTSFNCINKGIWSEQKLIKLQVSVKLQCLCTVQCLLCMSLTLGGVNVLFSHIPCIYCIH